MSDDARRTLPVYSVIQCGVSTVVHITEAHSITMFYLSADEAWELCRALRRALLEKPVRQ